MRVYTIKFERVMPAAFNGKIFSVSRINRPLMHGRDKILGLFSWRIDLNMVL